MISFPNKFVRSFAKYFTTTHEWIDIQGNSGTVGITEYAQHHMGDVVFADFQLNKEVKAGEELGDIESVKATSPIMAPMSGKITAVNPALADSPGIINKSPEKDGWCCKLTLSEPSNLGKLMDEEGYKGFLKNPH